MQNKATMIEAGTGRRIASEAVEALRTALALGMSPTRYRKTRNRRRASVAYLKPAPAGRGELHRRKLRARMLDGQGRARHVTPPPASMVEAYRRRPGGELR